MLCLLQSANMLDDYFGVYPTILFLCGDNEHAMHFVLSLKNTDESLSDEMVKIMRVSVSSWQVGAYWIMCFFFPVNWLITVGK